MADRFLLSDFVGGWFIGDFSPSLCRNSVVEVGVKRFSTGAREEVHHQRTATEWTVVLFGECMIGAHRLSAGDILEIPPGESAGFLALSDVTVVVVKSPSNPSDKAFG